MVYEEEYAETIRRLEELEKRKKMQQELQLATDFLATFKELRVKEQLEHIGQLDLAQRDLSERFTRLEEMLKREFEERQAHRAKSAETLELLNKYLKDWT